MITKNIRGVALLLALQLFPGFHVVARADQPEAQPGSPSGGFGIWDQIDGKRLVGDKFLYEFRMAEGCLVIAFADPEGKNWSRWVVCHAPDGSLRVADHPRDENPRYATMDDSGVLTICYQYMRYDSELVSRFIVDGDNITHESGWMEKVRKFSRERQFFRNDSETLQPATSDLVQQASANLEYSNARNNEERERKEQREAEERAAGQQAAYNYLNGALATATAQAEQSQANLDATLARIKSEASAKQQVEPGPAATSTYQPVTPASATSTYQPATRAPAVATTSVNASPGVEDSSRESRTATSAASTRDIAGSCMSAPVVSAHKCYDKTGTQARLTNNCSAPVDVRVCFMTDKGWNCQANYGVNPGKSWEPGWCAAVNSQVFHSERYSDSKEPLDNP